METSKYISSSGMRKPWIVASLLLTLFLNSSETHKDPVSKPIPVSIPVPPKPQPPIALPDDSIVFRGQTDGGDSLVVKISKERLLAVFEACDINNDGEITIRDSQSAYYKDIIEAVNVRDVIDIQPTRDTLSVGYYETGAENTIVGFKSKDWKSCLRLTSNWGKMKK